MHVVTENIIFFARQIVTLHGQKTATIHIQNTGLHGVITEGVTYRNENDDDDGGGGGGGGGSGVDGGGDGGGGDDDDDENDDDDLKYVTHWLSNIICPSLML